MVRLPRRRRLQAHERVGRLIVPCLERLGRLLDVVAEHARRELAGGARPAFGTRRSPGWKRGGRRVRRGAAAGLARVGPARIVELVIQVLPRLQAAADGAAVVVVKRLATALHVVLQPLLLGLQLLVPLLEPTLVLRQPTLLCVAVPEVPAYGCRQGQG